MSGAQRGLLLFIRVAILAAIMILGTSNSFSGTANTKIVGRARTNIAANDMRSSHPGDDRPRGCATTNTDPWLNPAPQHHHHFANLTPAIFCKCSASHLRKFCKSVALSLAVSGSQHLPVPTDRM